MSLQMVQRPEPPYPADVMARGWGFTLEVERLTNSDTWAATEDTKHLRPWLLMLWMSSWTQTPCGSLPDNDIIIARRIGMDEGLFASCREVLMRGWYLCTDGRFYHRVLTELVERMRDSRAKDREKKAKQRSEVAAKLAKLASLSVGVPGDTPIRPPTGTGTGTGTGLILLSTEGSSSTAKPPTVYRPPDCPHIKVLALWAEIMPDKPQHDPDEWRGARADHLRARWREAAAKEGPKKKRWANEQDGIVYFRRLFQWLRLSPFLMGMTPAVQGRRPFDLKLEWVVKQANWAKIMELDYHRES